LLKLLVVGAVRLVVTVTASVAADKSIISIAFTVKV
jgi:hypothetical protein